MEGHVSLHQDTLKDQAQQLLRDSIVDGRIQPGETLAASSLSVQLDISRTPIREALLALEQEGWVYRLRSGVLQVRQPSMAEIEELYAIRGVLEGLACRYAAERITAQHLRKIASLNQRTDVITKAEDAEGIEALGREFHALIHSASRLSKVREELEQMRHHINRYRRLTIASPGRPWDALDEHRGILEALQARNPAQAESVMRGHIHAGWLVMQQALAASLED